MSKPKGLPHPSLSKVQFIIKYNDNTCKILTSSQVLLYVLLGVLNVLLGVYKFKINMDLACDQALR
jgi:hypothetical protein